MTELIVTSAVLILVIAALRLCLRGRISARLQYALWGLVALRLLLPFSLFESPVSVMNLLPQTPAAAQSGALPPDYPAHDAAAPSSPAGQPLADDSNGVDLGMLALVIWLSGAALCGSVFLTANLRMSRRLQKIRVPLELPDHKTAVYTAAGLPSPCLYGLWKPAIYLTPESAGDTLRLMHILTHEETHYRHKDHLWALVRVACVCLHWYNPLVWLAAALSRRDGELACDEGALLLLGDESRIAYGKTLIETMAVPAKPSDLLCCATTMSGGKGELAQRLRRIAKKPKLLVMAGLAAALITVTAVAATFGGAVDADVPASISLSEQLWNARTDYVGDASAVGKLVGLLPVPQGLVYDHFKLHTRAEPYEIEIVYTASPEIFAQYDRDGEHAIANPFSRNALVLLALVDNAEGIRATIESGERTSNFIHRRSWAEDTVGGNVRRFAESARMVEELQIIALAAAPDSGSGGKAEPIVPILPEAVTAATITHALSGTEKVYVATGSSLNGLRTWAQGLHYEHKSFPDKNTPGDAQGGEVFSFALTGGDYPEFSYIRDGQNEGYLLIQGEWYSVSNPSDPPYDRNAETPKVSYSFTRYGKGGEVISIAALTDEELAQAIVMDVLSKSSAWQGVDVNTLDEYYLIRQTMTATDEALDYYAYLLPDGRAVLQSGQNGMYGSLSQELYDELDGIYAGAVERTTLSARET